MSYEACRLDFKTYEKSVTQDVALSTFNCTNSVLSSRMDKNSFVSLILVEVCLAVHLRVERCSVLLELGLLGELLLHVRSVVVEVCRLGGVSILNSLLVVGHRK